MAVKSASPKRPFRDSYLLKYSAEHVFYEFDMFLWVAAVCSSQLTAPATPDASRRKNVMIEAFAVHLRNVINFLYPEKQQQTDVVAADFFAPNPWDSLRPPISKSLKMARVRANKEIAHLTTDRIAGAPPDKVWNFQGLADEIRPLLRRFSDNALQTRLSSNVAGLLK